MEAGLARLTAKVIANGRVGDIVAWDPDDAVCTYKLSFLDGQAPSTDWFSASSIEHTRGLPISSLPLFSGAAAAASRSAVKVVNPLTGASFCEVFVESSWTISQLKDAIEVSTGTHVFDQRLMFKGRMLSDEEVISDCFGAVSAPSVSMMRIQSQKGNCPQCRRADLQDEQRFVCDKRGTWWETYAVCPECTHSEFQY
eukprot:TRINITY_DN38689_c0_g1_i1.p1 TRINITY_DN38689_c0_g1~~TRINITY_DN38689_c0_g1_i1.p1  ORF type:complete len:198 (+),score=25.98 TRINITY_DN38689_c0_g1_i1:50-643(+)